MSTLSRRTYLAAAGVAAVTPFVVGSTVGQTGPGGRPRAGDTLDFERAPNGDIDFDDPESGTRFRTRGDDLDHRDSLLRCDERRSSGRARLTRFGVPDPFDFRITEPRIRVRVDVDGERIESDSDGVDTEFGVDGGGSTFEDDGDDEIDYRGRRVTFRQRGRRIEVAGDLRFRFDGVGDTKFRDDDVDLRTDERRFRCRNRLLELRYDRDTRDFEARRVA